VKEGVIVAKLIPYIDAATISNNGEKALYTALTKLPDENTVCYSYKYGIVDESKTNFPYREADFIVMHSQLGYMVIEVKQGDISCFRGGWQEFKKGSDRELGRNPVEQAESAMFAIAEQYKERFHRSFPLKVRFGLCFPECTKISGDIPSHIKESSILLFDDIIDSSQLEKKIIATFGGKSTSGNEQCIRELTEKILAPKYEVFSRLEDKIDMFYKMSQRVLTDEQSRILEETEYDSRKIFLGGAGTGKTWIAKEKARRLAMEGKKVFLTCYNRKLASLEFKNLHEGIFAMNFHDYLEQILPQKGYCIEKPNDANQMDAFYRETLPSLGFDYFSSLDESERFDAVIVDEGQDFREDWITCLEASLKKDGYFYIFADPNQNIFADDISKIKQLPISKHKLTRNLRNTEAINNWIKSLYPESSLVPEIKGGLEVRYFKWKTYEDEKRMIEDEVGRLISQGVKPRRITLVSGHKKKKSCMADADKLKSWPLKSTGDNDPSAIRFDTIRSFKGLEADIVFLIDVKQGSPVYTKADIYVGGSRARFLLYIFHHEDYEWGK